MVCTVSAEPHIVHCGEKFPRAPAGQLGHPDIAVAGSRAARPQRRRQWRAYRRAAGCAASFRGVASPTPPPSSRSHTQYPPPADAPEVYAVAFGQLSTIKLPPNCLSGARNVVPKGQQNILSTARGVPAPCAISVVIRDWLTAICPCVVEPVAEWAHIHSEPCQNKTCGQTCVSLRAIPARAGLVPVIAQSKPLQYLHDPRRADAANVRARSAGTTRAPRRVISRNPVPRRTAAARPPPPGLLVAAQGMPGVPGIPKWTYAMRLRCLY